MVQCGELRVSRCCVKWTELWSGKQVGPQEMFKTGGNKCFNSLANIFKDILCRQKLPVEWMLSLLVLIFKGKRIPLIQTLTGE